MGMPMDQSQTLPLKDIHLPETISFWPPAIGWWLILILFVLLLIAGWILFKKITRVTITKQATIVLQSIKNNPETTDLDKLQSLCIWLRRVAISSSPRHDVASLSGTSWLNYLDSSLDNTPFSKGIGKHIISSQYQQSLPDDVDLTHLFELCEHWLKAQK